MKQLIYIIFIILIGCNNSKTDFTADLNTQDGYGIFRPGNVILWPSQDSLNYRNVPKDINEYVVRSLPLQADQYFWNKYVAKEIGKDQFEKISKHYNIDTTTLSNKYIDCEVLILIGTQQSKRIIIVDSDNDGDFGDEKIFEYEYPLNNQKQKEIQSALPQVLTQYEYFENNRVKTKEIKIKPSPYKGSLGLTFNTENQIEKKYYLFASFPEFKKGNINLNGQDLEIFVSNGFSRVNYPNGEVSLFLASNIDSLPSELKGDIPYQIGDVFNVKGHDYLIDSITNWGDRLFIKYVGLNSKSTGINEGFYIPKFKAKRLDNSIFELEHYPNNYILLDFWGTWCNPCIKLIPELKQINSEFSKDKFVLVSVAFDNDPKKVSNFISKENMNWEHIFVNQNKQDRNSLIEKLKVTSFPTTILIAPDGKIIARDKTMDELREILKNAL
ncbi:TlpA family protein disulfide reductase [Sinomicrobium pectinilyticum]|nr:TlpA disulfide reductase family protein [Sinomicrobium pectinilyticum]